MTDKFTIPKIFDDVKDALNNFTASTTHDDGRRNSSIDEDVAIDILNSKFTTIKPPIRAWYDIAIKDGNNIYYCNIKSSSFKAPDNFNAKMAMLYCFTNMGVDELSKCSRWEKFEQNLVKYKDVKNDRNYYIIVINKNDGSCIVQSLKTITNLFSNGNNLPFQINWNDNKTVIERTHFEARDFVIGAYKKSVKKKVEQHKNVDNL
jgi:hypothetical protein